MKNGIFITGLSFVFTFIALFYSSCSQEESLNTSTQIEASELEKENVTVFTEWTDINEDLQVPPGTRVEVNDNEAKYILPDNVLAYGKDENGNYFKRPDVVHIVCICMGDSGSCSVINTGKNCQSNGCSECDRITWTTKGKVVYADPSQGISFVDNADDFEKLPFSLTTTHLEIPELKQAFEAFKSKVYNGKPLNIEAKKNGELPEGYHYQLVNFYGCRAALPFPNTNNKRPIGWEKIFCMCVQGEGDVCTFDNSGSCHPASGCQGCAMIITRP